jgi:hypothetical protein
MHQDMIPRPERSGFGEVEEVSKGNIAPFDCAAKSAAPLRKQAVFLWKTWRARGDTLPMGVG